MLKEGRRSAIIGYTVAVVVDYPEKCVPEKEEEFCGEFVVWWCGDAGDHGREGSEPNKDLLFVHGEWFSKCIDEEAVSVEREFRYGE